MALCSMTRALSFVRISTNLNFLKKCNITIFPKIFDMLPAFHEAQMLNYSSNKSTSPNINKRNSMDEAKDNFPKPERKKKLSGPRITLIHPDDSLVVITLEEAQKIAKRRNLKLVKIVHMDTKTDRATYKLMTGTEYFQEEMKRKEQKASQKSNALKPTKLMVISTRIAEFDLVSKIKNINKWLIKNHDVRILISVENNKEASEVLFQRIIKDTKDNCRLINERHVASSIKFHLHPLLDCKDSLNKDASSSNSTSENHA